MLAFLVVYFFNYVRKTSLGGQYEQEPQIPLSFNTDMKECELIL